MLEKCGCIVYYYPTLPEKFVQETLPEVNWNLKEAGTEPCKCKYKDKDKYRDKYNCFPFQYSASNGTMCNKEQLLCLADNLSIEQNRSYDFNLSIEQNGLYIWT